MFHPDKIPLYGSLFQVKTKFIAGHLLQSMNKSRRSGLHINRIVEESIHKRMMLMPRLIFKIS
jgi:hypothetical protein